MQILCMTPCFEYLRHHTTMSYLSHQLAAYDPKWTAAQVSSSGPMTILCGGHDAVAAWKWELAACTVSRRLGWGNRIMLEADVAKELRLRLQSFYALVWPTKERTEVHASPTNLTSCSSSAIAPDSMCTQHPTGPLAPLFRHAIALSRAALQSLDGLSATCAVRLARQVARQPAGQDAIRPIEPSSRRGGAHRHAAL